LYQAAGKKKWRERDESLQCENCRARNVRADFAGENPSLLTPGGMVCHLLFVAGSIDRKRAEQRGFSLREVADPTGVFELRKMRPDAGMQAPSFPVPCQ